MQEKTTVEARTRTFTTTDLGLAAYARMRGLPLLGTEKEESGRTVFIFDDRTDVAEQLRLEYHNSEFAKFDGELRQLKKLIFR